MNSFFLGVDAGATKTHAVIIKASGEVLGVGHSGCGSHEVAGYERAGKALTHAIEQAVRASGVPKDKLGYAAFCLAGIDIHADEVEVSRRMLDPLMAGIPYLLKNDAFGCLRGGTRDPFGVMINCGTGQVAVGRNRAGVEIRVGGYGWDFGDFGGGGAILQATLAAVVRADDGRGEPTQLVDAVLSVSGCPTVPEFIERSYRDMEFIRGLGLPKIAFRVSRQGDRVARRIILAVADEMAVTAITLIRRLGMQEDTFDLITAGSVFKGEDPVFLEVIGKKVHEIAPGARLRMPLYPPVVGCALLALESAGFSSNDEVYANIEQSLKGKGLD